MLGRGAIVALLVLLACQPSIATAASPPSIISTTEDPKRAKAVKLAELTNPLDLTIATFTKAWHEDVPAMLAADPDIQALEDDYPGVTNAMLAAAEPALVAQAGADSKVAWERLADIYVRELTVDDLDEAIAFFDGPLGRTIVSSKVQNLDSAEIIRRFAVDDDPKIRVSDFDQATGKAAVELGSTLSDKDRAQLTAFFLSPAGRKLAKITPELKRTGVELANAPNPEFDARIESLMAKAIEAFINAYDHPTKNE